MLCMVLSSSHTPCVGSLFQRYPSCPVCSSSRPYSHALRDLIVFLTPIVVMSLVIFLMPGMASLLTSSSCPGWHRHCRLPHTQRGIHGVLPFHSPWLSMYMAVFRSARRGLRYTWWSSIPLGVAYTAVFCSVWRGLQYAWWSSVLLGAAYAVGFNSVWRGRQYMWWSSVLLIAAYAAGFSSVWRGSWYAWPSSIPLGTAYAAVFRSAQRGIRSGVLSCPTWPSICAAVLSSARRSIRDVLPFCSVRIRSVLPFCPARHTRQGSVLSGAAVGIRGGLLFCSA